VLSSTICETSFGTSESAIFGECAWQLAVRRQLGGYFRTHPLGRRRLDEEAWHWLQGEAWFELLATLNNFAYFPRLYDLADGTYHCDLRRYYAAANAHFDAANGLLQGIRRFEETGPEPAVFFSIAQVLADFFAEVGRPAESTAMYRKMLGQPEDLLGSSFSMRLRVANLRVSMARVLQVFPLSTERFHFSSRVCV
jgi:hypothetical protein